jgi:hypothetical protein
VNVAGRRIRGLGIAGPAVLLLFAACGGGGASDRQKVERALRRFEHSNGAVVHRVSCGPLSPHRWSCRVLVDDPNGTGRAISHTCDVSVRDGADVRGIACGG